LTLRGKAGALGERLNRAPPRHAALSEAAGPRAGERSRGRRLLLVVGVFFFGPLIAAWLLHASGWRPGGLVNHGVLLTPPMPLPPLDAPRLDDGARALREGLWTVVILARGDCAEACRKALDDTRRVRDLLGADRDRVQRVLIAEQRSAAAAIEAQSDLIALDVSGPQGAGLLDALDGAADGAVYVADPQRNLLLRYAPGQDAKGLFDDLERLLKYAGRF
jgi:hypothetical protein